MREKPRLHSGLVLWSSSVSQAQGLALAMPLEHALLGAGIFLFQG